MKIFFLSIIFSLLLIACSNSKHEDNYELQKLYESLDHEIANSSVYEDAKNNRINVLRKEYESSKDEHRRTRILNDLINEFESYNADSTLFYLSLNLKRPAIAYDKDEYTRLLIKRADVFAHAGLFSDALETIYSINRDSLNDDLLEIYYSTCCGIYQYLSEYTYEHESASYYEQRRALYADSLNLVIAPGSFNHMVYIMTEQARNGDAEKAIENLSGHINQYQIGTREYSILASTLAYIYKTSGHQDKYKHYLTLSAISDVQGAVKENMSFRELATVMFEDGDIDRANKYLKKSISDANFYSALMRNAQSSKILPIIDDAYASQQQQLTRRLRYLVWISSVLSLILIVSIFFILRQFKSLRKANKKVNQANIELSELSNQLKDANIELHGKNNELSNLTETLSKSNNILEDKNAELSRLSDLLKAANIQLESKNKELGDFNRTKEQYAGLFMEYCSSAISTLQHYQQSLRVLTAQGGSRTALMKKLESSEMADQLLKNFYLKFDEAILNIYPAFVEKFNALLKPDECVVMKAGELLSTELRLFALIRIGIDDSAKIAEFLRCSISTVYTYRSKMRRRAKNPDSFETDVKNIG